MRRSLPYIGISRMTEQGVPKERIGYVVQKGIDAFKAGKSDKETEVLIREAAAEEICRSKLTKRR